MNQKTIDELYLAAKEALKLSYSPYSHFAVGAVILTRDGVKTLGANIENAAYPSSMCAERVAMFSTYAKGYKKDDIIALAIIGDTKEPITPCGGCRQVMSELLNKDVEIVFFNLNKDYKITNLNEILPFAFDEKDL